MTFSAGSPRCAYTRIQTVDFRQNMYFFTTHLFRLMYKRVQLPIRAKMGDIKHASASIHCIPCKRTFGFSMSMFDTLFRMAKVSKVAKIRNRYNQVPHLTQDTNGKVTNSQKTPQARAKRSTKPFWGFDHSVCE